MADNNYLVFTRKWRPQTFEDIIGQEQVTVPLKRAIELNRIMHAYLFSGPRGTGKTTTARVFAKALNCEKGPTPTPCNVCVSCDEIKNGNALDVIEIDGASNRGIDEIRKLKEYVGVSTAKSRYKVYIIDEVHMLTKEAFNALLKTLEEPPKHVIFIFATTDPQNIPPTILSRCQHFRFKRLSPTIIVKNLKMIAANEKIDVEEEALFVIAKAADGALRDGQRIFDQLFTFAKGEKVTAALASKMLGEIEEEKINKLIKSIFTRDLTTAVQIVERVFEEGYDIKNLLKSLIEMFRNILIMQTVNMKEAVALGEEEYKYLQELSALADKNRVLFMLQRALDTEYALKNTQMPNIILETYVIEMIMKTPGSMAVPEAVIEILPAVKPEIKKATAAAVAEELPGAEEGEEEIKPSQPKSSLMIVDEIEEEEKIKNLTKEIIEKRWDNVLERAKSKEITAEIQQALSGAGIIALEEDHLTLIGGNPFFTNMLKENTAMIKELIGEEFKKEIKVTIYEKSEYDKRNQMKKSVSEEEAQNHPMVKSMETIFGKMSSIEIKKQHK